MSEMLVIRGPAADNAFDLRPPKSANRLIVLRTPSGLSGDMLVTGLSRLAGVSDQELNELLHAIGIPELRATLSIKTHSVSAISGWKAVVALPPEHAHRRLKDIKAMIEASALGDGAKRLSIRTFQYLAEAESRVHGMDVADIAFHEVGALDSILDICMSAALYTRIAPQALHCSPLPLCDGVIACEHGLLASPAPAVQEMLSGVPVYGIASRGETVTPTALAFLRSVEAFFGDWPRIKIESMVRAYGGRVLPGVPNGAIFALGSG